MSDYELLDKLIPLLKIIHDSTQGETDDMLDIAKYYLSKSDYRVLVKLLDV